MVDTAVIKKENEFSCKKCGMIYVSEKWARLCQDWCSKDGGNDEMRGLIGQCLDMIRIQGNLIDKIAGINCAKQQIGKTNNMKEGAI